MGYVIVGILLLFLIGGFITYLVMRATQRSSPAARDGAPGIGSDPTPLGDTAEHAEGDEAGAPRAPGRSDPPAGRFKRDPVGGEAEGEPASGAEPTRDPGV